MLAGVFILCGEQHVCSVLCWAVGRGRCHLHDMVHLHLHAIFTIHCPYRRRVRVHLVLFVSLLPNHSLILDIIDELVGDHFYCVVRLVLHLDIIC